MKGTRPLSQQKTRRDFGPSGFILPSKKLHLKIWRSHKSLGAFSKAAGPGLVSANLHVTMHGGNTFKEAQRAGFFTFVTLWVISLPQEPTRTIKGETEEPTVPRSIRAVASRQEPQTLELKALVAAQKFQEGLFPACSPSASSEASALCSQPVLFCSIVSSLQWTL